MSIPNRYSYANIRKAMQESIMEYLDELKDNPDLFDKLTESQYRNDILSRMKKRDENIGKIYGDKNWVDEIKIDPKNKQSIGAILSMVDGYLENILKEVMEIINEEHAEYIEVYRQWESKNNDFHMASVYAEELLTEDEYQEAMNKYKQLLKELADKRGIKTFKLKREMPPFESPFDAIEWLEDEMDEETIDDYLENPEEGEGLDGNNITF